MTDPHGPESSGAQYPPQQYRPQQYPPQQYPPQQYPPQQYPPQGSAPPQYGTAPGYPPPQYGATGYPPIESSPSAGKRKLVWVWVSAAVVAAVAVALLVVFLNRDKHPSEEKTAGRSLTAPATFGAYRQLSGFDTGTIRDQLGSQLESLGSSADKIAKDAILAVYAKAGASRPQFVLIGFPVKDVPRFRDQIKDIGLDAAVKQFVGGLGTGIAGSSGSVSGSSKSFDPGPLGGAMRCQQVTASGTAVNVCGWGDRSFFAMNLVLDAPSLSGAADVSRTLRNSSER